MTTPFYDEGCGAAGWKKWPVRNLRRLLRKLQRPAFAALQGELDSLRASDDADRSNAHRAFVDVTSHLQALTLLSEKQAEQLKTTIEELRLERAARELLDRRVTNLLDNEGLHVRGLMTWIESHERDRRSSFLAIPLARPVRVLFAISSSCQMYSGIGRAIFETVRRVRGRFDYEFAMDDGVPRNLDLLAKFCEAHGIPLHTGAAQRVPGTMDYANAALPGLLRSGRWDAIECVSWGSAATNGMVLEFAGDVPILYTPHYQPMWTVPGSEQNYGPALRATHGGLLQRAALVACDSPWEWLAMLADAAPGVAVSHLPLGLTPEEFAPGLPRRSPQLLFVGDLLEPRKRFSLALKVFAEIVRQQPQYRFVVVGNKSEEIGLDIPLDLRSKCVFKGYISEVELRTSYRESAGLFLLSDYEAFGLPVAEALASGTPVFLSRRPAATGVFEKYRGAVLLDDDSPERMAAPILAALSRGSEFVAEVIADVPRVTAEMSWDRVTELRAAAMGLALRERLSIHPSTA